MKKISDILWVAANQNLHSGLGAGDDYRKDRQSCCAVAAAELGDEALEDWTWLKICRHSRAIKFLHSLGCQTGAWDNPFDEFKYGEQQQGARYLWLMFAYLVALDEGL